MTKELATIPSADFLALQPGNLETVVEGISGVSRFELPQLRVPSGGGIAWEVETLSGPEAVKSLDLIVLEMSLAQRKWYRVGLDDADEGGGNAPDCQSSDGTTGVGCHELKAPKEGTPVQEYACAKCQWAQWGSDRGGRKGQDCRQYGLALCLAKESLLPMVLSVPATSLRGAKAYRLRLLGGAKKLTHVVTRVSLTKVAAKPAYSTIDWGYLGDLDEEARKSVTAAAKAIGSSLG